MQHFAKCLYNLCPVCWGKNQQFLTSLWRITVGICVLVWQRRGELRPGLPGDLWYAHSCHVQGERAQAAEGGVRLPQGHDPPELQWVSMFVYEGVHTHSYYSWVFSLCSLHVYSMCVDVCVCVWCSSWWNHSRIFDWCLSMQSYLCESVQGWQGDQLNNLPVKTPNGNTVYSSSLCSHWFSWALGVTGSTWRTGSEPLWWAFTPGSS